MYEPCDYCGWNGVTRKDGTMRAHRPQTDAGRVDATGTLPQMPDGPLCAGSHQAPYRSTHETESAEPTPTDYATASRIIQSLIPGVRR